MHFLSSVLLGAAVTASTASAGVIPRAASEELTFQISNFTCGHVVNGGYTTLSFEVSSPTIGLPSVRCTGSDATDGDLGFFYMQPCQDEQYLYSLEKGTDGRYTLAVNHPGSTTYSGAYEFPVTSLVSNEYPPGSGRKYENLYPVTNPFSIPATAQGPK